MGPCHHLPILSGWFSMVRWLMLCCCCLAWGAHTQATELRGQSTQSLGSLPAVVAASDLNWTITPDLVVVNPATNTVTVIPVTSFAGLGGARDYAVGQGPVAAVLSDLSGDGYPDIAVANEGDGTLSVLVNRAFDNIDFFSAVSYAAGSGPVAIVSGLFNNDGANDLVVVDQAANSVSVMLNSGSGTFPNVVTYATGSTPVAVAAADFDGNGTLDLAVANRGGNSVSVLLNDGNGLFTAGVEYPLAGAPSAIAVVDADGDGALDLAVTRSATATVALLHNSGNAIFTLAASYDVGLNPAAVVAVDMNGDLHDDLVVANKGGDTVTLLESNRDGSYRVALTAAVGTAPASIAFADMDVDGDYDLVVANSGAATLSLLMNDTDFLAVPFSFTDQVDAPRGGVVESDVVTLSGMTGWARISVSAGEYSVSSDGGTTWSPWSTTTPAVATTGDRIKLRVTASALPYVTLDAVLRVGGQQDAFSVRSYGDTIADQFLFTDQRDVATNTLVKSNTITITGLEVEQQISVIGGMYSLNGAAFTTTPSQAGNGDTIQLLVTSAPLKGETVEAVLYVGAVSDTFTVTTVAERSSGGGGGAAGPLLLPLAMVLAWRRSRRLS